MMSDIHNAPPIAFADMPQLWHTMPPEMQADIMNIAREIHLGNKLHEAVKPPLRERMHNSLLRTRNATRRGLHKTKDVASDAYSTIVDGAERAWTGLIAWWNDMMRAHPTAARVINIAAGFTFAFVVCLVLYAVILLSMIAVIMALGV